MTAAELTTEDPMTLVSRLTGADGARERDRLLARLAVIESRLLSQAGIGMAATDYALFDAAISAVRGARTTLSLLTLSGRSGIEGPLFNSQSIFNGGSRS